MTFTSWNARALLHHDLSLRSQKIEYLRKLLSPTSVVGLQEVHGTLEEAEDMLYQIHKPFKMFASFSDESNVGGLLTFFLILEIRPPSSTKSWFPVEL